MKRIVASAALFTLLVITGCVGLAVDAPALAVGAALGLWALRELLRRIKRGGGPTWRRFKREFFMSRELVQLSVRLTLGIAGTIALGADVAGAMLVAYAVLRILSLHVMAPVYRRMFKSQILAAGLEAVTEYRSAWRPFDTTSAAWVKQVARLRRLVREIEPLLWIAVLVDTGASAVGVVAAVIALVLGGAVFWSSLANFVVAHRRGVFQLAREQLLATVSDYDPELIVYFSAPSRASIYQLRQWIPAIEHAGRRTIIVTRERNLLGPLSRLSGDIPALWVARLADLDVVAGDSVKVALYVNNGVKNGHMVRLSRITHVQLLHGESDKGSSVSRATAAYDRIGVAGKLAIDRYARAGIEIPRSQFLVVGRPSTDAIEPRRSEVDVPTVLYAPTWEGLDETANTSSVYGFGPEIIRRVVAADPPLRLLVKLHPLTGTVDSSLRATIAEMRGLLESAQSTAPDVGHDWLGPGTDIVTSFNESDLLISDISSVIADYLASGKPMMVCDVEDRGTAGTWEEYPTSAGAWIVPRSFEGFDEALRAALSDDPMRSARDDTRRYVLGDFVGAALEHFRFAIDDLVDGGEHMASDTELVRPTVGPTVGPSPDPAAPVSADHPAPPLYERCPACEGDDLDGCTVTRGQTSRVVTSCNTCGLLGFDERPDAPAINSSPGERLGSVDRPGRDHAMAMLGVELLDRSDLSVMMLQPGVSCDGVRIESFPDVASVCSVDLADLDRSTRATRHHLVLGNEVLQAADPASFLCSIAGRLDDDGLAVISTDLYDGSDLGALRFPFTSTNRWFWSATTLGLLAEQAGLQWDVRLPAIAVRRRTLRKRYVFLSRSDAVMERIRTRFATTYVAPSEVPR